MSPDQIAIICHEANRAYCEAMGDTSQAPWHQAPKWQQDSAINGVEFHLANPGATPENSHENWMREKAAAGRKYGPVKDADKLEHPCFRPYGELPIEQRAKDHIFRALVHACRDL